MRENIWKMKLFIINTAAAAHILSVLIQQPFSEDNKNINKTISNQQHTTKELNEKLFG